MYPARMQHRYVLKSAILFLKVTPTVSSTFIQQTILTFFSSWCKKDVDDRRITKDPYKSTIPRHGVNDSDMIEFSKIRVIRATVSYRVFKEARTFTVITRSNYILLPYLSLYQVRRLEHFMQKESQTSVRFDIVCTLLRVVMYISHYRNVNKK